MRYLLICIFSAFIAISSFSQSETDVEELTRFAAKQTIIYQQKKAEAIEWATQNGYPITIEADGSFIEIQYIDEFGRPQYYQTDNSTAAATISTNKVYPGGGAGLSLTGSGITVREWDAGSALTTHQEFGGRVTNVDGASSHYHSTHVAGTIMASGVQAAAKGMAYQANLRSRDWNNDVSEMATEASNGALISNHSYGLTRGWSWNGSSWNWYGNSSISTTEDYLFGFYDANSQQWDQVARNAPNFLICKSAGNDRNEGPGTSPPNDGPYDCIGQQGIAKNILTVGAVEDIPGGYTNPASVVMSSFSSWGPADDGRIKPDIVANGVELYSTDNDNNTDYSILSGTSMSTPSVAGSLALLQQHRNTLTGSYMKAATLKALVIHTADESGTTTGPDYKFGWGLMNTKNAALRISADQTNDVISEHTLSNGGTYTRAVTALGSEPLKVTIVWTDVAGTPTSAQLDPISPMLVNDLDLRLTRSTNTYYPWKLDRNNPTNAATNSSENNVDNVEVVYIASPVAGGTYTITVDHDGTLSGGSQAFSMVISGISTGSPPVANFSASTTTPNVGQTVTFTDLSTNSPTNWSWSFTPSSVTYVGGTSSTSQNPQVQFNTTGYYTVTLTATNAAGSDGETKNNYIFASAPPVANFSANNTAPAIGQTVIFTDLSTNSPTSWTWSFTPPTITYVGGTNASSQHPQVQFTAGGNYTVSLTAFNAAGSDNETKTNYISVLFPPVADFDADNYSPIIGQTVYFWDMSSNSPTSWVWSFSPPSVTYVGGTTANSPEPQVQFTASGSYTVTLTATNASGSDSEIKTNFINVPYPPVANFSASITTPIVGQTVTFTDLTTNSPTSWFWSFSPANVTYVGGTSPVSQNPQVKFNAGGFYTVTLTATNVAGSDIETKTNYIFTTAPPVANFSASTTTPYIGQTVLFTDLSTNTPTSWSWVFSPSTVTYAGGTTSASQNPQVQFSAGGFYTVTLTATNAAGSDPETKTNYVSVLFPPVANFSANNTAPAIGQTIAFTDLSTNSPTSWAWSFNPATVTYVDGTTSASQNPQVQFSAGGLYTVTLIATNASGSDPETKTNYVSVLFPPVANFSANNTAPAIGQTIAFTDLSTNSPTSWAWSFNPATVTYVDGTTSASQNPQVQFSAGGLYTVTLIATNASDSDPETKTNYISVLFPPVANFSANNTAPAIGQTIAFTDLSTNSPTSWTWSFSPATVSYVGSTTSASQNPQVQFLAGGLYTVTLTSTNASGSDGETKTDYIAVLFAPVADFSADNTNPAIGQTVTFTDLSANNPTSWSWDFSPATATYVGGTTSASQNPLVQFSAGGLYTVTLTSTNASGSEGETKTDYIAVLFAPVTNFSADNTNPAIGQTVTFTDLSANNPTSWSWDFSPATVTYLGGTTSASQNPQVQFSAGGLYTVTLTSTNASGSDGETKTDYLLVSNPIINLDITVYLEGPFNGSVMNALPITFIPFSQPYNITPWNYNGSESVGAIPNANVVDWVLVELRDAADAASATFATMMDRQAAFLISNGKVVGLDGTSTLQFTNSLTQQLFVVIWHRNHLGVMSASFLTESGGTYSYDFSTGASQAYGSTGAHKQIGSGVWGMTGGDGNCDGTINTTDKIPIWEMKAGKQGYFGSDYNFDAQVDNKDKNDIWILNEGAGCQVPN